jgi:ubiquinone biosynthesis protein
MNLVKASIGLSKTVKNMGRFREIVTVFAKNGFAEFMASGVSNVLPNFILPESTVKLKEELSGKAERDIQKIIGSRLRVCFEELGPAFIKIGQLLSSREDLFDRSFILEMKKLQDQVKGIEFSEAKKVMEKAWGKEVSEVVAHINEKPIGTASIGVVYEGELVDGKKVVIKVRRPHIRKLIKTDMEIFLFLILQIEKVSEEIKYLGLSRITYDFSRTLESELNFHTEALNCQRLKQNISGHDSEKIFYLPEIYDDYVSEDVLVMEKLEGIPFSSEKILTKTDELKVKLEKGIHLFIKTFLKDGFFHADLHGGNFFYLDNGKIGLVDFGLMGVLGKKGRVNFLAIIYSILSYNFENLVYEFLEVADYDEIPDTEELISDVRDALYPYIGLSVQKINMSILFGAITKTLAQHKIYLPREWFVVFRALVTLDGVGKSLKLDFDLFGILETDIKPLLANSFSKEDIVEEASWLSKDYLSLMRMMPRQLKWFWREFAKNRYSLKIQTSGHEKELRSLSISLNYLGNSIIVIGLLLIGTSFLFLDSPLQFTKEHLPTWIMFGAAFSLWTISFSRLKK